MIASTVLWYATLLLFVQMQTVPTAIVCLVIAGFSQSLAMISIAVILMRTAAENFRGRVMGVRMMVIYGLPFGLLAAGSLIDEIGFAATGTLYAVAGLALMLAIVLHWRADLWPVHAPGQRAVSPRRRCGLTAFPRLAAFNAGPHRSVFSHAGHIFVDLACIICTSVQKKKGEPESRIP